MLNTLQRHFRKYWMMITEPVQTNNPYIYCNEQKIDCWQRIPEKFYLENNLISVFGINLDNFQNEIKRTTSYLSEEETSRSERFHFLRDKQRFVVSRSILKILISKYLSINPKEVIIGKGLNNKPCLIGNNNLEFNLSHSGDWIIMAISNHSVGIDLEFLDENFNYEEILLNSFANNEKAIIKSNDLNSLQFFKLWTRKEAFAKALAKGIDDDFVLLPSLDGKHSLGKNNFNTTENWTVSTFALESNYIFSLAYQSDDLAKVNFYEVTKNIF